MQQKQRNRCGGRVVAHCCACCHNSGNLAFVAAACACNRSRSNRKLLSMRAALWKVSITLRRCSDQPRSPSTHNGVSKRTSPHSACQDVTTYNDARDNGPVGGTDKCDSHGSFLKLAP